MKVRRFRNAREEIRAKFQRFALTETEQAELAKDIEGKWADYKVCNLLTLLEEKLNANKV
jgi:hypothetical protein